MEESFAISCPPFSLQLSHWDMRYIPIYSKRVLCFPLPNSSSEHQEHITQLLLAALRSTVDELPFLAGSVVPFSKQQPWLRDLRPHGAAYLEVKDLSRKINYLDLRKARFSPSLLDPEELCPFPKAAYIQDSPVDVCRLRVNFVDGGLLLVVSIIHTVCDGRGISEVLKIFADKLLKAQAGKLADCLPSREEAPKHSYSFDRSSVLSGNGISGSIENHPCWTASPVTSHSSFATTKTVCTAYHINSDSLRALKEAAIPSSPYISTPSATINIQHPLNGQEVHSSGQSTRISTHDAIAALIWRSTLLARHRAGLLSNHATTHFSQAVDCRSRLHLPEPYFGNAIYGIKASLTLPELAPTTERPDTPQISGLQTAACAIRD